jgi:muramoyltetrapeptide carboxypeptidase LdcA involved in peptidoglycan recycling
VAATAIAVKFGVRYGDFYKIGDSEYRRTGTGDALRIVVPSVVAAVAVIALLLSRLMPHGLRSEFSDEIEELRQARKWSSERRAAR